VRRLSLVPVAQHRFPLGLLQRRAVFPALGSLTAFPRVNLFLFFLPLFKFVSAVIWIITVESWSSFEPSDKKAQSFFYFFMLSWWFLGHVYKLFDKICERQ
jgi:hypothetical protein